MAGYKVRVASSVNGFLQALVDEGAPDLLLLDVMLPDGDGFDVLGKMRRHQALGSLPIVMLTARNDAADIGRGLILGADGYITKPYTKAILADVIEGWLLQRDKESVHWIEAETHRRRPRISLESAPIEVGPILKKELFGKTASVVLTSATLAVGRAGTASYVRAPRIPA